MTAVEPPLAMLAELTHRCPLRCPYCSNPLELSRASAELDTESWKRVLGEAATLGARTQNLVRNDAAQSDRLATLEDEVAMLKAKFRALLPADPLESLANGGTDVLTLRTTLDAQAERSRHEYIALNKRIEDLLDVLRRRALAVGVLDAQHQLTAVVADEQPVEQRRTRAADVQRARRRWCEASPHASTLSPCLRLATPRHRTCGRRLRAAIHWRAC